VVLFAPIVGAAVLLFILYGGLKALHVHQVVEIDALQMGVIFSAVVVAIAAMLIFFYAGVAAQGARRR
jgi:TRAP-type C4-dicarboxylate transport system permease small subunit